MKWPWTKRLDAAKDQTAKAAHEYEWAVQERTTVQDVVKKLITHGTENGLIEKLNLAVKGHR